MLNIDKYAQRCKISKLKLWKRYIRRLVYDFKKTFINNPSKKNDYIAEDYILIKDVLKFFKTLFIILLWIIGIGIALVVLLISFSFISEWDKTNWIITILVIILILIYQGFNTICKNQGLLLNELREIKNKIKE